MESEPKDTMRQVHRCSDSSHEHRHLLETTRQTTSPSPRTSSSLKSSIMPVAKPFLIISLSILLSCEFLLPIQHHHDGRHSRGLIFVHAASSSPTGTSSSSSSSILKKSVYSLLGGSQIPPSEDANTKSRSTSFHEKFETYGPTLTVTLKDPFLTSILSGSDRARSSPKYYSHHPTTIGDSNNSNNHNNVDHGLTSKLAALFHISRTPPSPSTSGDSTTTTSSSSTSTTSSAFQDGYMLDDGEIFLGPPSENGMESSSSSSSRSSSRGLFSFGTTNNSNHGTLGGWGKWSSWSEYIENVHPEIRYEFRTRQTPLLHSEGDDDNDENNRRIDTLPFPKSMPWLSSLSCGLAWSPFPIYKNNNMNTMEGYGHKLLSSPHFVRCGARLSLPHLSNNWRRKKGNNNDESLEDDTVVDKRRMIDLGMTYRDRLEYPGGTVEVLLGRSRPTLPPRASYFAKRSKKVGEVANEMQLQDGEEESSNEAVSKTTTTTRHHHDSHHLRSHNHFLVRFATRRLKSMTPNDKSIATHSSSSSSSIEYARGSFHIPPPFFLRDKCQRGLCVSPSYDFLEGKARCVFSGDVGSSGRTRAVLRLDSEDSTLTLVRALDDRKIIAPTISLQSGKIVYDWYLSLDDDSSSASNSSVYHNKYSMQRKTKSSIRAHVDPTKGIRVVWTDGMPGKVSGGCWVTECRVPLGVAPPGGPLAADIRVGRRWVI